ncbi:MAG TPA: DNA mismatch repair endonuclease MutL [Burkholderiales bacterium]|nr:DNA mismatch repair endonuclease MutL [Burkholderiales bacterium]
MTARIKQLPDYLVNRIAAGEVVERPASALKELIENSIDAKATKIIVELLEGGIKQIKIVDNGEGIFQDDIAIAINRHTTSKISSEDDLYQIKTLGFRGEGLASIASVSRFMLSSKVADYKHGYKINSNFGIVSEVMPTALNDGTIIEVNDLYHSIPARKKFLKTETTEYSHCKAIFERLALSYCDIFFEFYNNGKMIYRLSNETHLNRIVNIFGESYSSNYFEINEMSNKELSISGYVYHPSYSSNSKIIQHFYINGRFVKDRVIQNAIKQAFSGVLHHEHQPQYILFLKINPLDIDINVHPSKSEVRFKDTGQIHSFISGTIRKALSQNMHTPPAKDYKDVYIDDTKDIYTSGYNTFKSSFPKLSDSFINRNLETNLFNLDNIDNESKSEINPSLGFAIAHLLDIYILAQTNDGLIIVDTHAAHERILLEKLKKQLDQAAAIASQQLLLPIIINIPEVLQETIIAYKESLLIFGFEIDLLGENQLIIRAVPTLLSNANFEKLVLSVLNELSQYGNSNIIMEHREKILSTIACHNAIRANDSLSIPEMNAILRDMEITQRANYCNHGRPTWFKITMSELNAMFMRGK